MASLVFAAFFAAGRAFAQESDNTADSYDLKVITFNVAGLPDFITHDRGFTDTNRRFARIGDLLQPYDIIGLQEAFVADRDIIEKKLADRYVIHGTDVGSVKVLGSGVYTFSRWPIRKSHFEKWERLGGADAFSHKGFVAGTVEVSRELAVDVYNLHGQTKWKDMKLANYEQLAKFMEYFSIGQGRPILLIGDFNCRLDDEVCNFVMKRMNMTLAWGGEPKVDHIYYNENDSGWKMSTVSAAVAMDETLDGKLISDHTAVEAVIRIEKN